MVRVAGERSVRAALGLIAAVVSVVLLGGGGDASARGFDRGGDPTISVLSGRADLVSGGDALISIRGLRSARGLSVRGWRQGPDIGLRAPAAAGRPSAWSAVFRSARAP